MKVCECGHGYYDHVLTPGYPACTACDRRAGRKNPQAHIARWKEEAA